MHIFLIKSYMKIWKKKDETKDKRIKKIEYIWKTKTKQNKDEKRMQLRKSIKKGMKKERKIAK